MHGGVGSKAEVFLRRYLDLVRRLGPGDGAFDGAAPAIAVTVGELGTIWDASPRAVRDTLGRLAAWSLVAWRPRPGRGRRSALSLLVHPVHVYFTRAERAERDGRPAEAAFWYGEILADCPCIEGVAERLAAARARLGLAQGRGLAGGPCCPDAAGGRSAAPGPPHADPAPWASSRASTSAGRQLGGLSTLLSARMPPPTFAMLATCMASHTGRMSMPREIAVPHVT